MIQSWKFINGEKIMFPTSSNEAIRLGWYRVKHDFYSNHVDSNMLNVWLKDNIQDRAYYIGAANIFFYRELEAATFVLKWA